MYNVDDLCGPKGFYQPVSFAGGMEDLLLLDIFIARMERRHAAGNFDCDPGYQREHVWTLQQREAFMGHLLEGGATLLVICNRHKRMRTADRIPGGWDDRVVDGKQRLTTAYLWRTDQIPGRLTDGRPVWWHDLDANAQRVISGLSGITLKIGYVDLDEVEEGELYLRLNKGGTVHTPKDIAHAESWLMEARAKRALLGAVPPQSSQR